MGVEARVGFVVAVGAAVAAVGVWMFGRAFAEVEEAGNPAPY